MLNMPSPQTVQWQEIYAITNENLTQIQELINECSPKFVRHASTGIVKSTMVQSRSDPKLPPLNATTRLQLRLYFHLTLHLLKIPAIAVANSCYELQSTTKPSAKNHSFTLSSYSTISGMQSVMNFSRLQR